MTAIFGGGHWELVIILVIALLLFGHRIPGMARALGSGITEFKRGLKGGDDTKSLPDGSSSSTEAQSSQREESTQNQ